MERGQGEPLKLRVFIDRSVVEVFVNGKQYLAMRVYPGRKDSVGVSVRAQGQDAVLKTGAPFSPTRPIASIGGPSAPNGSAPSPRRPSQRSWGSSGPSSHRKSLTSPGPKSHYL